MTPKKLEEKRAKGLCYSCDRKYTIGHKCTEKKLFYVDCEEDKENEEETSNVEDIHQEETIEEEEMSPTISRNGRNYHSSNSQDRRTYQEEKGNSVD